MKLELLIDRLVDFAVTHIGDDMLAETGLSDQELLKQYVAFHLMHGNILVSFNTETEEINGVMIAYECDLDEAKQFVWEPAVGKNCVFVAQVAAKDQEARDTLAAGFLMKFPSQKPTYGFRRGQFMEMRGHDIANNLTAKRHLN